jgi:hypothetical protein
VVDHASGFVLVAGHMIVGDRNDAFTSSLVSYLDGLRADRRGRAGKAKHAPVPYRG